MKPGAKILFFAAVALAWILGAAGARSQSLPMGSGTNLSSVMYFEPPNEQMVNTRLSGAEMAPLPGAKYDVKRLKIERFGLSGKLEGVAEAPQCIYAPLDGTANSSGHLVLSLDEGRIQTQGDGFSWRQNEKSLVISNNVRTIIMMGNAKLPTL